MKELFLDKSLVTNPNVTGELVLVYIALRKVMSDEVPLFSNYRRVIVYEDGQYKLLRGSVDRWTGEVVYTLKKERYIKYTQTYDYKKVKVTGSSLVVGTFIVNYDMMNNKELDVIWNKRKI